MNSKIIMKCLTICLLFIGSAVINLEGKESTAERMRRETLLKPTAPASRSMSDMQFFSMVKPEYHRDSGVYKYWTGRDFSKMNPWANPNKLSGIAPGTMTDVQFYSYVPETYQNKETYGLWTGKGPGFKQYYEEPIGPEMKPYYEKPIGPEIRPSFYQRHRRVIGGTAFLAALALGFYYRASLAALVGDREAWNKTMQNAREKGVLHIVREYFNKHGAASWESIKNWRISMPSFSRPEWTQGLGSSLYNASANAASYLRGSAGSIAGGAGAYWLGRRQQPAMPMQQPMQNMPAQ